MAVWSRIEEVRLLAGEAILLGQWDIPRTATPPLPQAVLVPNEVDDDRDATRHHPTVRPLLDVALGLIQRGIATFRCDGGADRGLAPIWKTASRHDLMSRQRIGIIACGPRACTDVVASLDDLRPAATPLGIVLVAPDPDLDPELLGSVPAVAVIAGAGPGRPGKPEAASLAQRGRDAEVTIQVSILPDLTERLMREEDWVAGRGVTHPGLVSLCATAMDDFLKPTWERAARPPGTAIGVQGDV